MDTRLKGWLVVGLLLGTAVYAIAEEISLTTYYPSPKGAYQTLSSTSSSYFASYEGSVGIGTRASPAGTKFAVAGSPAVDPFAGNCPPGTDWYDENGDTFKGAGECKPTALAATVAGKVGIGTMSPAHYLTIASPNRAVNYGGGTPTQLAVYSNDPQAADRGGQMTLGGGNGGGGASETYAFGTIAGRKDNSTDNNYAGYLQLSTTDSGSTINERMRITSTGSVGIGTPNPGQALTVAGTIESTSGGFKFPDTTVQTTAATPLLYARAYTAGIPSAYYMNGANSSNAMWVAVPVPTGTLRNLRAAQTIPVTSPSVVVTVYKNWAATALACSISSGTTACSNTSTQIPVVQGDFISFRIDNTANDPNVKVAVDVN